MDDEDLIETIARGYSVAYGESPDEFVRTVKTKEQTRIRKWHLWVVSARAALAAIREARYAVVPQAQADRYAAIVREKRIIDKSFANEWFDAQYEAEDRLDDLIIAAAQEAKP